MPERMKTRMFILVPADSSLIHVLKYDIAQMIIIWEMVEGRHVLDENIIRTIVFGSAILDIVNNCPANRFRNRQCQRFMCLVILTKW